MAGTVAVRLHDAMLAQRWLQPDGRDYRVTWSARRCCSVACSMVG
ncbi:ArsR family transcriptional regulator [Bordetella pertussis]|nr:ArsR family transcriptional regulator [Bordetella pertussis]